MDTIIDLGSSKVKITTFDQKKKIISGILIYAKMS